MGKLKEATVVAVDGRRVVTNVTGKTVQAAAAGQPPNPNEGRLVPEFTVDLREAQTIMMYEEGQPRGSARPIRPAEIRPGDKISAGWADRPSGAAMPNSATVVRTKPQESDDPLVRLEQGRARTFTAVDAITGAKDTPKTADGVPVGENYPNTKQVVGEYVKQGELSDGNKVRVEGVDDGRTAAARPGPATDDETTDDDQEPAGQSQAQADDSEAEPAAEDEDLDSLTVAELKERADAEGVEYDSHDKKADLVKKLNRARRGR